MAALVIIVLLLMNPRWKQQEDGLDLWVLLDRSESTGTLLEKNVAEWITLLEGSRRSGADSLMLVDYASEVLHRKKGQETEVYAGSRKLTRTALAIENTLALSDSEKPTRLVVFTDGYSTEAIPPGLAEKLQEAGVAVDYRLVQETSSDDFRVGAIHRTVKGAALRALRARDRRLGLGGRSRSGQGAAQRPVNRGSGRGHQGRGRILAFQ